MKQLLTVLLIVISGSLFAQGKSVETNTKPVLKTPPDSVEFISTKAMTEFLKWLPDNVSYSEYNTMKPDKVLQIMYQWMIAEWNKKQKPKQ